MTALLRILVADDEAAQRNIVAEILSDQGHVVDAASSGEEALDALAAAPRDLLLTDLKMPGIDGMELLRRGRELQPDLIVILMTGFGTVSSAVEAMKSGAWDYLQKPFDRAELIERVRRVAERVELTRENIRLRRRLAEDGGVRLIGESPVMQTVLRHVAQIAGVPGDVLLTGESGTGKELVARELHQQSRRADGPIVAVNCGAIPEGLAESHFFGHEKGAFTHAVRSRAGVFEQADGGTLFLDEVASLPLPLQPKLLRILQERVVERVGSQGPRTVDVRVVAATNRDLREMVAAGRFRDDLYHRLNVHEIHLPALRDRGGDIRRLAAFFRDRAAARYGMTPPEITAELQEFLDRYPFPGNVRELGHMMEKMVVLSDGNPLRMSGLPPSVDRGAETARGETAPAVGKPRPPTPQALLADGAISLDAVMDGLMKEAVRLSGGNLSQAAKRLGLSYKTMRYRWRKISGGA